MAVPNSFSANTQIKSVEVNENFDYLTTLIDTNYCVRAYLSTEQSLTAGTDAVLDLDTEDFDPNSVFSTTSHKYVAPVDGIYFIKCHVSFKVASSGDLLRVEIKVNGSLKTRNDTYSQGTADQTVIISDLFDLSSDDEVTISVRSQSNDAVEAGAENTNFNAFLVSRS